ncbi:MAG TPA: hypothetical protein VMB50_02990 [Myxococcales bacterium]|nr:hypothetical protein [Myxococcales bacterium]
MLVPSQTPPHVAAVPPLVAPVLVEPALAEPVELVAATPPLDPAEDDVPPVLLAVVAPEVWLPVEPVGVPPAEPLVPLPLPGLHPKKARTAATPRLKPTRCMTPSRQSIGTYC